MKNKYSAAARAAAFLSAVLLLSFTCIGIVGAEEEGMLSHSGDSGSIFSSSAVSAPEEEAGDALLNSQTSLESMLNGHIVCLDPIAQGEALAIAVDTAVAARDLLEKRGYQVVLTQDDPSVAVSDEERAGLADTGEAEIFVKISSGQNEDASVSGAAAICPSADNPDVPQLFEDSDRLAKALLGAYCTATGLSDLGVRTDDTIAGLNLSAVPVAILEVGNMSNEKDKNAMENVEFRDMMTTGIVEGIDDYFGIDTSGKDITTAMSGSGSNAKLDALMAELSGRLPQNNGQWAVFVGDLQTGACSSIGSQPMLAASLIKLYIMGAVMENYDALAQTYGAGTLDSLLSPMITISDNDAANTLTTYLGGGDAAAGMAAVTGFAQAHGFLDSSMGRLLLHSNEFGDNYTSVNDCGQLLMQIYNTSMGKGGAQLAGAEAMFQLLKGQTRRNKIPSQMPADVGVANKTGELDNVENDAAIIYNTPTGNDLVIVFMSQNVAPGNAQATIAELSRYIYDYMS